MGSYHFHCEKRVDTPASLEDLGSPPYDVWEPSGERGRYNIWHDFLCTVFRHKKTGAFYMLTPGVDHGLWAIHHPKDMATLHWWHALPHGASIPDFPPVEVGDP